MPTLTFTPLQLSDLRILAIEAGRSDLEAALTIAAGVKRSAGPKPPALGGKGHDRCRFHEPVEFGMLRTRVLCFDDPKPTRAAIEAKRKFAIAMDKALFAKAQAWAKRPTGDGKVAMGPGARRLTPRQYRAWLETPAGIKAVGRPISRGTIAVAEKPRPKRERGIPVSKLDSTRRRARRAVIKLSVHRPSRD